MACQLRYAVQADRVLPVPPRYRVSFVTAHGKKVGLISAPPPLSNQGAVVWVESTPLPPWG